MSNHASAVVIGGGAAGCSIAYHLAALGWRDVVVLEKGELTSGSTFHSAGLVGQLRSSLPLTRLMMKSVDLYGKLQTETGRDPGWHPVGSLRVASSTARMQELRRQAEWAKSFGLSLELLSAAEAVALFPFMSKDELEGAAYLPTDGYVDPSGVTFALAAGARARGARFLTGTPVREIAVKSGRIAGVITDRGRIETEIVVNAAGIWAPDVGRLVGVAVPIVAMSHQYLITKPLEGICRGMPTMRDPDRLVYFREEVGGLLMGGYERHPSAWGLDGIPPGFSQQLLAPDWPRFEELMRNAVKRVPALESAEVVRLINGPEAFTPDGEFILGEAPDLRGFFVATGFCAHGVAGAGGVGQVMAEWIVEGRPRLDLRGMDLRRFASRALDHRELVAQVMRVYSTYYDLRRPGETWSAPSRGKGGSQDASTEGG